MKTIVTLLGVDGKTEGTWIVPSDQGTDAQKYYEMRDAIPVVTNGRKLLITTVGEDVDAVQRAPNPIQAFTDAVVLSTMDQASAAQLAAEGDFAQAEKMFVNALQHMEKFQHTEQFQKLAENYVRFLYDHGRLNEVDDYCIKRAALYFWKKDDFKGRLSFSV